MMGTVSIGDTFSVTAQDDGDDGFLPGFNFTITIFGFMSLLAVATIRRRD